jgi:predicted O-methyltransferase YrrM
MTLARLETIEGWLTANEARCLYDAAQAARLGLVEIGSYRGKSTVALALGARDGQQAPFWAIDPHAPFDAGGAWDFGPADRAALLRNLLGCGVAEDVQIVMLPSLAAACGWWQPIDLLFIDGDHSEAGTLADWRAWSPWLAAGGLALLHDREQPGPAAVLASLDMTRFERLVDVDGLARVRRL